MVSKNKIRICISLDEYVYKKLCYETDKSKHPFSAEFVKTKSQYINDLIDSTTKILEDLGIVKK